ncbi:MAG: hypothetical protein AAF740_02115 [Bacteroidota bacterium]
MKTNLLYAALQARYEAQMQEALATIDIYFNHPAGIGEHANILEEIDKQLNKLVEAEDKLEALEDFFHEDGTPVSIDDYFDEEDEDDEDD